MTAPIEDLNSAIAAVATGTARAAAALGQIEPDALARLSNYPLNPPFSNMSREDWLASVRLWLEMGPKLVKRLPKRNCPACGSALGRDLFQSYDGYTFCECNECFAWYVPKQITMELFEQFFDMCPEARQVAHKMLEGRLAVDSQQADRERIGAYLDELIILNGEGPRRFRYLDYGCGVGNSLIAALDRGMEPVGLESDGSALQLARSRRHNVRDISEPLPEGPFDFISFWESLEHMAEPLAVLQQCARLLRPRGLIAITVPNQDSPIVKLMRGDCPYVHGGANTPGHINLFGRNSMQRLLERAGLALLDSDVQYSNNPIDLFAYFFGRSRGVADMLNREDKGIEIPRLGLQVLNSIWPSINLIERVLLTGPILRVTACRKDAAPLFHEGLSKIRERRREDITANARQLLGEHPQATAQLTPTGPAL